MSQDSAKAQALQWLREVSAQLDLDQELIEEVAPHLLDLTKHVAHGPARPAAPLTTFLVGLAAGRLAAATKTPNAEQVLGLIAKVEDALEQYRPTAL